MANKAQVAIPSGKDKAVEMLVASFTLGNASNINPLSAEFGDGSGNYGEEFATEIRIAERIVLQSGKNPSYAIISIPMARFGPGSYDEAAFAVAAVTTGPAAKLLLNSRCSVFLSYSGKRVPLLNGTVINIAHDLARDAIVVTIYDDKWMLSRVTAFGQAQYDPETKRYGFVSNEPLVFNMFGYCNCLDTPYGPRFAPCPNYGWRVSSTTGVHGGSEAQQNNGEPSPGYATARARRWRAGDAIEYLRDMHYIGAKHGRPASAEDYGTQVVGRGLTWPAGLGSVLGARGGSRTLHNVSCEGLSLDAALTRVISRAGPYELYCAPGGSKAGDNENDVAAGLLAADPSGVYATLEAAFDGQMSSLSTAFESGYEVFETALNNATSVMGAAMDSYVTQLGAPYNGAAQNAVNEMGVYIKNQLALLSVTDAGSATELREKFEEYFKQYAAAMGVALTGSPGRYPTANGAIVGGGGAGDAVGVGGGAPGMVQNLGQTLQQLSSGKPAGDGSTLQILDMSGPIQGDGFIVPKLYGYGLDAAMNEACVTGGTITESIENFFHNVCVVGDAPVYESVFSMDAEDSIGGGYLEKAWSADDEAAVKAYVAAEGNTETAFKEACNLWPLVFCAYRVNKNYMARLVGTKHANKLVARSHPRIRPNLITGYSMQGSNPRNFTHRPVTIEYQSGDEWIVATQYDNLQLSQDGSYFTVSALRDAQSGITWTSNGGTTYEGAYLEAVNIRATLAIELDWRMTGLSPKGKDDADPNKTAGRVAGGALNGSENTYTYTVLADELDYVEWLRYQSYPVGQQIPEAYRVFDDKATAGNELFTDKVSAAVGRLPEHAKARLRDVRRVESAGSIVFPRLIPAVRPGVGLPEVIKGDRVIKIGSVVQRVVLAHNTQEMTVDLAAAQPKEL